ncbi:cysteine proteinase [Lichtheimia corymbifera JMRC:FSU:9682]|uniref:ubiquitinyl hydrolase 1 n=1 Tax=Lichtheimia corymbifera JMRC:FSU:9682 TaxID=1263082 RepID=A0A068RPE2_9FUNG|nr:cysteine proteinase [Lichtheimia corymbifera JMRC:FSU:9682]
MTVHETRATPSPPSTAPSPNDTTGSNASDASEMGPDNGSRKTNGETQGNAPPPIQQPNDNTTRPTSVSDSESVKTRDAKFSIMDSNNTINHLLPEISDLETEEVKVFHWHIEDWRALEPRCHGPEFTAGGFPWRILLFPRGNNQRESVSIYLEVADPASHGLPDDWHVCAQFSLVLSNPEDSTNFYANHATHRFSADEIDWGFTRFYELKAMARNNATTGKGPFLVNNSVVISVFVRVVKDETGVLWHTFANYDSRKETGYVGIKNQGATCYMNSLLQSLYCTNSFRKAVYQIPTDSDKPTESVSLALQRCFYNLQYSDLPIGTTELTKSFGWDSLEAFRQHDVQEFNRVLQDRLEEKMKGTPADGAISKLFVGKMKSYIKCINVDYESSRVEDYYDIQLNVKGCKDLHASFDDYIMVETLEGENKYMAEGHGLQDAKKGVIFDSFPPVLHLQLKRFEYDFMRDTMVKINDRHEFPEEINLDAYCSEDALNEGSERDPNDYVLHGVLVHSGDLHGGHYFALIKPDKDGKWYRFDDDRVTPVTKKEVFEENFGDDPVGTNGSPPFLNGMRNNSARLMKRFTNAYMLVYIRKSQLDNVLGPVVDDDIPLHLKRRVSEERAILERRRKDREEMHLHVKVAVITDSSFANRQEFDLAVFDDKNLETTPGVSIFKVAKNDKVSNLKQAIIDHYRLQNEKFRLWTIVHRTNKTVRVDQPVTPADEKSSVERLRNLSCVASHAAGFAKLYLEVADSSTNKLVNLKNDSIMFFLKYFDIHQQKIIGKGRMYVRGGDKVGDIIPKLRERADLPKDANLVLYEEVKPTMLDHMNVKETFTQAEIQHGDIVCFQLAPTDMEWKELHARGQYATVREYFSAVYNRVIVKFQPKSPEKEGSQEVSLTLDRRTNYNGVARELGKALGADPLKILFITANPITKQPKDPLPYTPRMALENMASSIPTAAEYAHAISLESIPQPVIYYDILDVNLADLESKKSIEVNVLYPSLRDEATVSVFVPRAGVAEDIIKALCSKGKLDSKYSEHVRVYEAVDGKITTIFSRDQPIGNPGEKMGSVLYVEQIPQEELEMNIEVDRLVQVVNYHKEPTRFHGVPFLFVVKKDESFSDTKKRLQQRLGVGDKQWQKVKCTIVKTSNPTIDPEAVPIEQDDCCLLKPGMLGVEDYIGLDRADKSTRTSRFGGMFERGIFIRG